MFDGIKKWLAEKVVKQYLPSLIRNAMQWLSGALLAWGVGVPPEVIEGLSGNLTELAIAIALGALTWSMRSASKK